MDRQPLQFKGTFFCAALADSTNKQEVNSLLIDVYFSSHSTRFLSDLRSFPWTFSTFLLRGRVGENEEKSLFGN